MKDETVCKKIMQLIQFGGTSNSPFHVERSSTVPSVALHGARLFVRAPWREPKSWRRSTNEGLFFNASVNSHPSLGQCQQPATCHIKKTVASTDAYAFKLLGPVCCYESSICENVSQRLRTPAFESGNQIQHKFWDWLLHLMTCQSGSK